MRDRRPEFDGAFDHVVEHEYASGEYRLREWTGLSERAQSGLGTGVVSADRGCTNADVGDEAEGGVGVAWGGFATAGAQRGGETAHRGGEGRLTVAMVSERTGVRR